MTARGRLDRREMVLLRLRDEDGLVGLGEAVPLSCAAGAALAQVVEELEGARASWTPLDEAGIAASAGLSAPARCAALTALLDLRGRRAASGATARGPRGGRARTGPLQRDAGRRRAGRGRRGRAERWAAEGFSTFKLKLGAGDDVGQVRAVREALGPEARIRVDANARLGRGDGEADAGRAGAARRSSSPSSRWRRWRRRRELAASTSIPIAGDESVESRADAERAAGPAPARWPGSSSPRSAARRRRSRSPRSCPPTSPAPSTARSGSRRRAQVAQTLGAARPRERRPRPRPRHPAPLLLDDRRGRVRAARRDAPPARRPRPRGRDRRGGARRPTGFRLRWRLCPV